MNHVNMYRVPFYCHGLRVNNLVDEVADRSKTSRFYLRLSFVLGMTLAKQKNLGLSMSWVGKVRTPI